MSARQACLRPCPRGSAPRSTGSTASKEFVVQLEAICAIPVKGSTLETYKAEVGKEIIFWNKWAQEIKAQLPRQASPR